MKENAKKSCEPEMISDEEGMILNFAVRYAIGRRTYAPSAVIQYVTPRLPLLNNRTLIVMYDDMNNKIMHGDTGDILIDGPICKQFFESIKSELDKRGRLNDQFIRPDNGLYDGIKITNADRIRMMSDEELLLFIGRYIRRREICDDLCNRKCNTSDITKCMYRDENGSGDALLGWLKEEAKQQ